MEYFKKCVLQNYANFSGRARRKEYWLFVLWYSIIFMVFFLLGLALSLATKSTGLMTVFAYIPALALLVPTLAVIVRRLHDLNKSGWYYFVSLIPLIGGFILFVWMCTEGDYGENDYGPDPKDIAEEERVGQSQARLFSRQTISLYLNCA